MAFTLDLKVGCSDAIREGFWYDTFGRLCNENAFTPWQNAAASSSGNTSGNTTDCVVRQSSGLYTEENCVTKTAHVICELVQDTASLALVIAAYNVSLAEQCFDDDEQCPTWAAQGRCSDDRHRACMETTCRRACGICTVITIADLPLLSVSSIVGLGLLTIAVLVCIGCCISKRDQYAKVIKAIESGVNENLDDDEGDGAEDENEIEKGASNDDGTAADEQTGSYGSDNVSIHDDVPQQRWKVDAFEVQESESPAYQPESMNQASVDDLPFEKKELTSKNRYGNILPNQHSRVPLAQVGDDARSTYINANYVRGHDGSEKCYIATQGPLPDTCKDFWRMVWETNSKAVVMVTGLTEKGRTKCEQYWPEEEGVTVSYGGLNVTTIKSQRVPGVGDTAGVYIRTTLRVAQISGGIGLGVGGGAATFAEVGPDDGGDGSTNDGVGERALDEPENELISKGGSTLSTAVETRDVEHFWYDGWPDHGAPTETSGCTDMLLAVKEHSKGGATEPWIVHCSAGIGRTGCFIGIDQGTFVLTCMQLLLVFFKSRGHC